MSWLATGRTCRTSVNVGQPSAPRFQECGQPTTSSVLVGGQVCHYCDQHAKEAQAYVDKQGQDRIKALQRLTPGR